MSSSKGNKRISVFDRLGPGNDESAPTHRRYSLEKHTGSSVGQEKGRGHSYGTSVPSTHSRMEDTPPTRDRKTRHRSSMAEYPSSMGDGKSIEDKRTSIPPPSKSSREGTDALKPVKTSKGTGASGESDFESGEEGSRRKGHHGDQELSRRGDHSTDGADEDASRRSRAKERAHESSHHRSPPDKLTSRREASSERKRRRDEDTKTTSELGHKRKRDHFEDGHLHEAKRARHSDHHTSRDSDHHHGNKDTGSGKQHSSGGSRTPERGRSGGSRGYKHSSRDGRKTHTGRSSVEKDSVKGSDGKGKGLDWAAVNSFTEKTNARLKERRSGMAVLGKFTPGATLAGIHVSPSLAGPQRYQAITELVQSHWKESGVEHREGHWGGVLQCPEPLDWDKALLDAMGSCRRALTASDDYVLRRLLRKDPPQQRSFISPVTTATTSWASPNYQIALDVYNELPIKSSGKSSHRLQTSLVGTLVL